MASRPSAPAPRPRAPWQYALAAVFLAGGVSDLLQTGEWLFGYGDQPGALALWHGVTAVASAACIVAVLGRLWWAPRAVAAWGVANATLVASLPFLLSLPSEARGAIWAGAAVIALFTGVCVWVVRRNLKRQ
ncbi:MAG: hypothetical protein HY275_16005 [Gemmatimonadetes bacterium]|nr:hypothetical protein [Gemmatimonadota bacterium]